MSTRVLIVVLDALRPEFVSAELMPHLTALAARGATFTNAHSTFPTETRVNQSAVTTGCYPYRHGVVSNQFPLPEALPDAVLNTGDDVQFEAALNQLDDAFLGVPTLGEILAKHDMRFATISAGTSGGGRLINIAAEQTGGFRLALRRTASAAPKGIFDRIVGRIGPPPEYRVPGTAWNTYAAQAYIQWVEPEVRPDVMLLWLSEPDESFHYHGIGSPQSLDAIRAMDQIVGEIVAHHDTALRLGDLHMIFMSDHGQISLHGDKLDVAAQMRAAGFNAATSPEDEPDYTVVVHTAGGVWVRDRDRAKTAALTDWLLTQAWCGPLFTREALPDTLPTSTILADHDRAPDIYIVLSYDKRANAWGHSGHSADNSPYPAHGGCHGGLSRFELRTTMVCAGSRLRQGTVIDTPVGNVDVLPTALALLGIPIEHEIDGRIIAEALTGPAPRPRVTQQTLSNGRTHLRVSEVNGTRYLDAAWATSRNAV